MALAVQTSAATIRLLRREATPTTLREATPAQGRHATPALLRWLATAA